MVINMDIIKIDNLKIYANHGVFDFEKENGQNFYVSAHLHINTQKAGLLDNLDESVSYALVADDIVEYVKENTFDLIEAVAEGIAIKLLDKYNLINDVIIEVRKPEAPIDYEFDSVSVTITRKRHTAYIAYGSNMGDSVATINKAKELINSHKAMRITNESDMIKSSAYGVTDQDDFYNGVLEVETYLEPEVLLDELHFIENDCGRVRTIHWGPRTLDLDIILYDDEVLNSKDLTIPHKDMANRDFVLMPLASIAGWKMHPVLNETIEDMAKKINERHVL